MKAILFLITFLFFKPFQLIEFSCQEILKNKKEYNCISDYQYQDRIHSQIFIIQKNNEQFLLKIRDTDQNDVSLLREDQVRNILNDFDKVIKIEDIWIENNYYYVIQELPQNQSLQNFLKNSQIFENEDETMKFFLSIIKSLSYVHSKGIIHANLSLQSIFVNEKNEVKIGNFEKSVNFDEYSEPKGDLYFIDPYILSKWDEIKIQYSPEQDIYSLGVIFYYSLFQYYPFEQPNPNLLYRQIATLRSVFIKSGINMTFVNLLNSTLKIIPQFRRKLYDMETLIKQGLINEPTYLELDIKLKLDSPLLIEKENYFDMFSEMIFILSLVFFIIPLSVYFISLKVKKAQENEEQNIDLNN